MSGWLADIGGILGKFVGIFLVAKFFNFLIKKVTQKDTVKQKFIATLFSTLLYIIIPTWITKVGEASDVVIGWNMISIIIWLIIVSFFAFHLSRKQFIVMLIYCIIGWLLASLILEVGLALCGISLNDNLLGIIGMGISALILPPLVYSQKLPFSKI